jgi:hypothetical protein
MRKFAIAAALSVAWCSAALVSAQSGDDLNIQIHGFATQSFAVSNNNNYLGMDTRSGSMGWSEAALNLNDQVSSKLRVGMQFHYTRLGIFGGDDVSIDWALGDYRLKPWLGVRAGKVKIRWGLYNDMQDYDPGYLWSLLPEPIYGVDWRATDLAQLGAELYGRVPLGKSLGKLDYSGYYGSYSDASNDGIMEDFREDGVSLVSPPGGKTPGFDLRWETPATGLKVGGSLMMYNATGTLTNGTYRQPTTFWSAYYGQYDFRKAFFSGQYSKLVEYDIATVTGAPPSVDGMDERAWFAMGGYHLTEKLQAGAYYTRYLDASGGNHSDPANYFHDWVVSGRFDFNPYAYGKLEGHFIDGNGVGFYGVDNPNGLKPRTDLMVAKLGFTF